MVIKPPLISNFSCKIFAKGAKQFVVHEAFETISCPGVNSFSLTPYTTVASASLAGAEINTFRAPACRCFEAFSFDAKSPVHSNTISTPKLLHGRSTGFFSEYI